MNAFETINDLRDVLNEDVQAYARIARDHYRDLAGEANCNSQRLDYRAKAERAQALWWVHQSETWAEMAENARNRTYGELAENHFDARERDIEAENTAARADLCFDRSVYYAAESDIAKEDEERQLAADEE